MQMYGAIHTLNHASSVRDDPGRGDSQSMRNARVDSFVPYIGFYDSEMKYCMLARRRTIQYRLAAT
eukprot:scaffold61628_cov31-Attheya_sp.AAC.1